RRGSRGLLPRAAGNRQDDEDEERNQRSERAHRASCDRTTRPAPGVITDAPSACCNRAAPGGATRSQNSPRIEGLVLGALRSLDLGQELHAFPLHVVEVDEVAGFELSEGRVALHFGGLVPL